MTVRTDCGFDNNSEKCEKCKFKTFSLGLLRQHQTKNPQDQTFKQECYWRIWDGWQQIQRTVKSNVWWGRNSDFKM